VNPTGWDGYFKDKERLERRRTRKEDKALAKLINNPTEYEKYKRYLTRRRLRFLENYFKDEIAFNLRVANSKGFVWDKDTTDKDTTVKDTTVKDTTGKT